MESQLFIINEIPVKIYSVTPVTILSAYNNFTDYVKTIEVAYAFEYTDVTACHNCELCAMRVVVRLTIDTVKDLSSGYINYNNLVKENFYPLAIESALASPKILKKVEYVRVRTGLDPSPPRQIQNMPQRPRPFS